MSVLPITYPDFPPVPSIEEILKEREPSPFVPVKRSMWGHFVWCATRYADFSGRATRAEYWSFLAIFFLLTVGIPVVVFFPLSWALEKASVHAASECAATLAYGLHGLGIVWMALLTIGGFLPHLAASCRRLHDAGLPGFCLLTILFPCFGVLAIPIFLLADSRRGANRYGPATKYP